MKSTHMLLLPLLVASTAAMAAPVSKKTVLNTQTGVVSQLANLQIIIGIMQFINETVQNNGGNSSGNCDPDDDGKPDGTASNSGPTQQTVSSAFLTGDEASLNITRRTWTKCALVKYTDTVQQQGTNMPISLAFTRNGVRDKAADKALGDRTIKFIRFGESPAKPLINTLAVTVGPGKVTYTYNGKTKTQSIPKVSTKFDFKNFYQLETRDNNTGDDQDALLYESAMDFNKYLAISGSIGDSKPNKATGKPSTPFLITRNSNNRIKAIDGVYGVDVKAPKGTLTALANSCQGAADPKKPLVMGAAKVVTISPLTTSDSYSGFGLFNTFKGFTGGELRFSDPKTDCSGDISDPKVADKCAVIKFNNDGTMNVKPAAKGATLGSAISQSSQYNYPMCTAAFILGPTAAFNAFLED